MTNEEYDVFGELSKIFDAEFAEEKDLPKIAKISISIPKYGSYTLGDMREWFKKLRRYPYQTIMTFGHGKSRVIGEGWSGGEFVSNVAAEAERRFVKLLGEPLYQEDMDELMAIPQEWEKIKKKEILTEAPKVEQNMIKRPRISIPILKKVILIQSEKAKESKKKIKVKIPELEQEEERERLHS